MYPNSPLYLNKRTLAVNMSQGDKTFQDLLDGLSTKEVLILKKYPELVSRVREITKMTEVQITAELEDKYDLEFDQYNNGDRWVSTENLEDCIPNWFITCHSGWSQDSWNGGFEKWARNFLMQEVRINIWIRYLEYNKGPKPGTHFGTYL